MYSTHPITTILITALAAIISLTTAAPLSLRSTIDNTTFSNLQLFSQYAAAAYCSSNAANANISTPIACPNSNNCPLLSSQKPPVTSVWEFQHSLFTDVTGYIALDPLHSLAVLSFRGTRSLRNWIADFDAGLAHTDICPGCKAWHGFWLSWQEARDGIKKAFTQVATQHPEYKTVVVGHSLGGAIADLAAADLRSEGMKVDLYTYGAPRVGGRDISDFITGGEKAGNGSTFRVTHYDDPVPKLPPRGWGFADVGPEYWIETGNGVEVGIGDISVYAGKDMSNEGDSGDVGILDLFGLDVAAHLWYFGPISSCDRKGGNLFE